MLVGGLGALARRKPAPPKAQSGCSWSQPCVNTSWPAVPWSLLPVCPGWWPGKSGWDVALRRVTLRRGSAVCFGPCISSAAAEWCLPRQRRKEQGLLSLALPIKSTRISVRSWFSSLEESVRETLTSSPAAGFPRELRPQGI